MVVKKSKAIWRMVHFFDGIITVLQNSKLFVQIIFHS